MSDTTSQAAGFPGMAVTVLLELHESDVAGTAVQECPELECVDRQHRSIQLRWPLEAK